LRDAIYGFAVGDALGVPYEFQVRDSFHCVDMIGHGTWNQPLGTWSDDTSMTLATLDSIKHNNGEIVLDDMMQRFCNWGLGNNYHCNGYLFDIGNTTQQAIYHYWKTKDVNTCGLHEETANGNGSLMRILPLLAAKHVTDETIGAVSALTHGHWISKQACVIYIHIAKRLQQGDLLEHIIASFKKQAKPFDRIHQLNDLQRSEIRSTGYVVDTIEASLWSLIHTNSYSDAVLTAVNLGGDTDTIAAITGGLAGIQYGYDSIPTHWIKKLRNKELIEQML
jgi:ADP-ribosylglycohydrolase